MEENTKCKYFFNYGKDSDIVEEVKIKLEKLREVGYFKGQENLDIYYEKYIVENEKGRIVLSHGFSEYLDKYSEIVYYFTERGYSVFGLEHRGHGRSGILSKINKTQVNVEKFDYYIEDFKLFIEYIVLKTSSDMYLYSHSMGGTIGTLFLEKYTGYFKKAILSTPMMEINTGKFSSTIASIISKVSVFIGRGNEFIIGQKPFDGVFDLDGSETTDENRYKNNYNHLIKNEELQRSGASFRWLNESMKATKKLTKNKNIKNIDIPILLFQAGKDRVVRDSGNVKFSESLKDCELVRIEDAKHELYSEKDDILHPYLDKIFKFLE